jgi:hypothetical protein
MSGLRPLSDMPGLAAGLAAQVVLLRACVTATTGRDRHLSLVLAGGAAGLAVGVRSQVLWLVAPLVLAVVVRHRHQGYLRAGAAIGSGFGIGALVWFVPLTIASGGLERYIAALRAMAGEDFANVQMLGTHPSIRALAFGLLDTFVRPWGTPWLASIVLVAAAIGTTLLVWRSPRASGWAVLLFGPYLALHLLFQETFHVRYALPLLVPVTAVVAIVLSRGGTGFSWAAAGVVAAASLAVTLPVARVYAAAPMPASVAVAGALTGQSREGGVIAHHFDFARLFAVSAAGNATVLPSPRFGERGELARYWAEGGKGPVWFVASPARTDLELIDPFARRTLVTSAWRFPRDWFLGGIRPAHGELVRIDSPGWVAGEGWHLTREAIILSERRGRQDAAMLVARRDAPAVAFIGGEMLPGTGGRGAVLTLSLDARELTTIAVTAPQPRFFRRIDVAAGALAGTGPFAALNATWRFDEKDAGARLQITHFELQPPARLFWVYSHGWHDREFEPATGQEWRWTSGRAEVRIHTPGDDVTIQIRGEVPIRDLEGPPAVTISAGARRLHTLRPAGAFTTTIRVPATVLSEAGGTVAIATDRTFVPDERTGNGDRRTLGLRVHEMRVNKAGPD